MFMVLINVGKLNHRLHMFIALPLHIMNWGLPGRRDLVRLWIVMLIDSHKDPKGNKHLDFLSISRFEKPRTISRI
jgi:hypothetical protein